MKLRIILSIIMSATLLSGLVAPALAVGFDATCTVPGASTSSFCQDQTGKNRISGATGLIVEGANIISVLAGIAAVIIILVGSIQFILSGGDSNKVSSAKNMIMYALIGLVVIVAAQTIIRFVLGKL